MFFELGECGIPLLRSKYSIDQGMALEGEEWRLESCDQPLQP